MKRTVTSRHIFTVFLYVFGFGLVASFFNKDLGIVFMVVAVPALFFFGLVSKASEVANSNPDQTHYGWKAVVIGLLLLFAVIFGGAALISILFV